MNHTGVLLGAALLLLVTIVAWLLARKANHGVRQFRADHHESFLGRNNS